MSFQLIDSGWQQVMDDALKTHPAELRVVCPFIKLGAAKGLLAHGKPKAIRVITRFNLDEFSLGVSDISALEYLRQNGAEIRGVKHLHAKVYLFGTGRAIATSANLTTAGLTRNHEFGFTTDDAAIIATCGHYFDTLWQKAGANLTTATLASWEAKVTAAQSTGSKPHLLGLGDEGVDVGAGSPFDAGTGAMPANEASQWFVKFFGVSTNRAARSTPVIEEIGRTGCHWAYTYPKDKRPRQDRDGAVMFLARLVRDSDDIIIYGRAIGMHHDPSRDDATPDDIAARSWKATWPHYVRVHHGRFVAGTLANGVSLEALMTALKWNAFAATKRNKEKGSGNTDPRMAYRQQAAVELTPEGAAWVEAELEARFAQHGTLTPADMQGLDWPAVPGQLTAGATP